MIKATLSKFGINQAILFNIGLRAWQTLAGIFTLFLIAHFFSKTQQGFYYTFNSVLMLQIFFEMGLSYVLIQFSSHEFARIKWALKGRVSGGNYIKRFKLLLSKAFSWYLVCAILFIIVTIPAGLYFLNIKATNVDFSWRSPWIWLVFITAINLVLLPFLACIEGSGEVKEVYRIRFIQGILGTCLAWIVIILKGGLYSAVSIAAASTLVSSYWLLRTRPLLFRIARYKSTQSCESIFSWKSEVWPMQWRIAISWISGYFINQIFVPILFYYKSPAIAGQMGMSLAISNVIIFIGQAWISAKAPLLGKIVAKQDWKTLDKTFYTLSAQSALIVFAACISFLCASLLFHQFNIFHRILPFNQLAFLIGGAFITHLINCIAQYLRSHKQEPFMVLSVIGGILIASTAWFFGKNYSSYGIVVAVFFINLFYGLPSALWLWNKKKKIWHTSL